MANPTIRGHQAEFKVFQDGGDVGIINCTSVDINQDSNFIKSKYVGQKYPVGDQSIEGWSGTVEMEVADALVDEFIDELIQNNVNGIGVSDYQFSETLNFSDGTSKSYAYSDCQWKMSKRIPAMDGKVTIRLEMQAMRRDAL